MDTSQKRSWLSWISVGVLALLCGVLALLQNHWITEVSRAERDRLQLQLQTELSHLSREFNGDITNACARLQPSGQEIDALGKEKAYAVRFEQWKQSRDRMFSRIALAAPAKDGLDLSILNPATDQFSNAAWPADWIALRDDLNSRPGRFEFDPVLSRDSNLIALPQLTAGGGEPGPPRPSAWLVLELNLDYIRTVLFPELLHRYLAAGGTLDYRAEIVDSRDASKIIFQSQRGAGQHIVDAADASVPLFEVDYPAVMRPRGQGPRGFRPSPRHGPPPGGPGPGMRFPGPPSHPPFDRGPEHHMAGPPPGEHNQPRWRLSVRHQAGSIEAVVSRARMQNLATSLGVLLLIVATVVMLLRFSRRAQQLAEVQMNFVAGVSHELRTPLTVIRTAAFNLRGRVVDKPEQVERYGKLIQEESEKLGALVEQVLRFAGTRAGHVIREREPVNVDTLIEEGLRSSGVALEASQLVVEKRVAPGLPFVLADELAMKFVLQNLIDNALKYGTEKNNWIGIFANRHGSMIEIRVADKGPGIPVEEQQHIFDPFFRGSRAVRDQVHGTGLGLNLVKKIVEAHGGTVTVESDPHKGAQFVLCIPAAPLELQHELAHPVG